MICQKCGEYAGKHTGVYEIYDDLTSSVKIVYCNHGLPRKILGSPAEAIRKAVEVIENTRKLKNKWKDKKVFSKRT